MPTLAVEEAMSATDLSPADWLAAHAAVSNSGDLSTEQRHRIMAALESFAESALEALDRDGQLCGFHQFVNPDTGEGFGSFELFQEDDPSWGDVAQCDHDPDDGPCEHCRERGFYWHSKFPGCLPDGDTSGPFASAREAWTDAQRI